MGKEKHEKMPMPGQKMSDKEIKKKGIDSRKESEYFVVVTKDRGYEPEEERKEVTHYLPRWGEIPDQELGKIPVHMVINALKKYYSKVDPEEKYPVREAIKRLRKDKKYE